MNLKEIFEHSCHHFIIEWLDSKCITPGDTSSNLDNFITFPTTESSNFLALINQPKEIALRQALIEQNQHLNKIEPQAYIIHGKTQEPIVVSEEIIASSHGKFVSIFSVITELVQQKELLKETSERLELVLAGTRLGMWDWDPQTNDVVFDERWANMLGVELADLTQTLSDWESRVHPDDIAGCFADITAHIEGKVDFYENTHRMKHADGSWRYILDRGKVVKRNDKGEAIRFTGTHTDVTDLKLAEHNAKEALLSRNKFFARVSHEIRTPLHGILGTADILKRRNLVSDDLQLVNIIADSGGILQSLLNDILDIAKLEEKKLEIVIREVNCYSSAKYIFNLFQQKALSKDLNFTLIKPNNLLNCWVNTDSTRLSQILANLVSNAVKFTTTGSVTVEVKNINQHVYIVVEDTGRGIEDTDAIFYAYEQEGSDDAKAEGTGLGLAIVKSLCTQLNISLTCHSVLGKGSRFELDMGEQTSPSAPLPIISELDTSEASKTTFNRVLVVDDNQINLLIAKTMLNEAFNHVDVAINGKEAVEMVLNNGNYDIVFMDLNMPVMNGVDATKAINDLNLPNPPIVVAQTADATDEAVKQFAQHNVSHIITKPFTQEKLANILKRLEH